MSLQTGFARLDITPVLGVQLAGYPWKRPADGILDPLYVTAVAFDNGKARAVVFSVDHLGIPSFLTDRYREMIAKACDTAPDAVHITCTHTHLGPDVDQDKDGVCVNPEYAEYLGKKLLDAALIAFSDIAPTKMYHSRGQVKDVAFVRRYRMRDGSARTNPGFQNPDILHSIGEPDEECSLLILKREGKKEIGIINFQVHPDCIGGSKISADYPKFVRDVYEKVIDNSLCMFITGTQGDTNHFDVRLGEDKCRNGYERARYMGRKIAMEAASNYELAEEIAGDDIRFAHKDVVVKYNRGTEEELAAAREFVKLREEYGDPRLIPDVQARFPQFHGNPIVMNAMAGRVASLALLPEEGVIMLSAVSIGGVVFAGIPGEPFTEVGRGIKRNSPFTLTIPSCNTNGKRGYFPMKDVYQEEGYEKNSARYVEGTAEKLIDGMSELIASLR